LCNFSSPELRAFPAAALSSLSNHTLRRLSLRCGTYSSSELSLLTTVVGSYHCHPSCSQSVAMAFSAPSASRKANGLIVHSRPTDSSVKVNGFPARQKERFEGLSLVSSDSSRHAAVRGSGSVRLIDPEIGATRCLKCHFISARCNNPEQKLKITYWYVLTLSLRRKRATCGFSDRLLGEWKMNDETTARFSRGLACPAIVILVGSFETWERQLAASQRIAIVVCRVVRMRFDISCPARMT
jgi:hypothetical protein